MMIYVVAWNSHYGLNGTNFRAFRYKKDALCFYNDLRTEFILENSPDLTEDALEAEFFNEEREALLKEIQENDPYGEYDLVMKIIPYKRHHENKTIKQNDLTSECWLIQFWGLPACEYCKFKDTSDCSGQKIREELLEKGTCGTIGINGLSDIGNGK